jgi:hypothetical protein
MWKVRWAAIIARMRVVRSAGEEAALLDMLSRSGTPVVLGFVNAHAMNVCASDVGFFEALHGADVLLRDGAGMSLLFRKLRRDPGLNMNGTDLIPKILGAFRGRDVALWGTREPHVARAAAAAAQRCGVRVVSSEHGFADADHYVSVARAARPELIVLGMGMPKQERLARRLRLELAHAPVIVCGGAILDFMSGNVERAPQPMRRLGLEWLYRLCREPRRLFRRYVLGNPLFILRLVRWRGPAAR